LVDKLVEGYWGHHAFRRADNGSEFGAHRKNGKKEWESRFKRHLESLCIKLITSGIKHPQTNGKIEKLFDCVAFKLFDEVFGNERQVKPKISGLHSQDSHNKKEKERNVFFSPKYSEIQDFICTQCSFYRIRDFHGHYEIFYVCRVFY